jgi:hypothetical protein
VKKANGNTSTDSVSKKPEATSDSYYEGSLITAKD